MIGKIARPALTLAVTLAAIVVGWKLWVFYTLSPWTRDALVQANVVDVAPDVAGLVTGIPVVDNQRVKKGDVLFVIDPRRFELALSQAEARVADSAAALKLAANDAQRDADLMAQDPNAISRQAVETTRSRAAEAAAALQLAQAERDLAAFNLERSTVRASVNGYVTNLTATVGDFAARGQGVMALVDSDSFYVAAYFMETKLPAIRNGDRAGVRLMAGGVTLPGTVQGVSHAIANPAAIGGALLAKVDPNFQWIRLAQRIPVRIALDPVPEDVLLAAGLSATVTVQPGTAPR